MIEIYPFIIVLTILFLDILPKAMKSPRGNENSNVVTNISMETNIPTLNSLIIVVKLMILLA